MPSRSTRATPTAGRDTSTSAPPRRSARSPTPRGRYCSTRRYDPNNWGEGINVAYADGHVELVKDRQSFEQMLKQAPKP